MNILAFCAHPDDIELNVGGTLLKYRKQGHKIFALFDESGKFQYPDSVSRFYIVSLVLHDQSVDVGALVHKLDSDWVLMGYEDFCFHAGPLILKALMP